MKFSRSEYGRAANTHCPFSFDLNFQRFAKILPLPKEREQPATVPVLQKSIHQTPTHDITRDGG